MVELRGQELCFLLCIFIPQHCMLHKMGTYKKHLLNELRELRGWVEARIPVTWYMLFGVELDILLTIYTTESEAYLIMFTEKAG